MFLRLLAVMVEPAVTSWGVVGKVLGVLFGPVRLFSEGIAVFL